MKKVGAIVILVFGLVAAALLVANHSMREPEADGRTLSEWLELGHPPRIPRNDVGVTNAIRKMGSAAVPFLLERLRAQDSPLKQRLEQSSWSDRLPERWLYATYRSHGEAAYGFSILGTQAVSAVPELTKLLLNPATAHNAGFALGQIGLEALPILKDALTNGDSAIRIGAASGLVRGRGLVRAAMPELLALRQDTNVWVPSMVIAWLPSSGDESLYFPIAVEYLQDDRPELLGYALAAIARVQTTRAAAFALAVPFLTNANLRVRKQASNTLFKLDAKTARAHGVIVDGTKNSQSQ